jgi:hypothetical protein
MSNEELSINVKPDYNMTFWNEEKQIGEIEWNDGVMKFNGNLDESAKVFFEFLKPYMDSYIKEKLNAK